MKDSVTVNIYLNAVIDKLEIFVDPKLTENGLSEHHVNKLVAQAKEKLSDGLENVLSIAKEQTEREIRSVLNIAKELY